ncbi:MAG: hypothetical protein ACJAWN_001569 [Neolewinella sp.]|jgi:hypothetical protein
MRENKNKVCDFKVISVMKGRTPSLADLLAVPWLGSSNPEELYFFSTAGNYSAKQNQYHGLFDADNNLLWGDITYNAR